MIKFFKSLIFTVIAFQFNIAIAGDSAVESELKLVVDEINKGLPRKVDETTRLLGVEQQTLKLIYYMEVFGGLAEGVTIEDFTKDTELNLREDICKKPSMKYFAENKVALVYSYFDYEGIPLSKITIDVEECYLVQSTNGSLGL